MNMKKIIAGAVASVLAVSTMAITASADTTGYALFGANWGEPSVEANGVALSGNWNGAGIGLPEDVVEAANGDFSNITLNFTATVADIDADAQTQIDSWGEGTVLDDMVAAKVGVNTPYADGFGNLTVSAGDSANGYASTYTVSVKASTINQNDDGTFYTQVMNGAVTDVVWTVTYTVAGGDSNGSTSGEGADPNKGSPDTGVEGVAVVAGLAIIAAGAVVVAKKRG